MASVCTSSRHLHCRERKLAAKAQGRRHVSSDEDESEDEAAREGGEGGDGGEQDPFFQHEDNPFDDPFFRVRAMFHLLMLTVHLSHSKVWMVKSCMTC